MESSKSEKEKITRTGRSAKLPAYTLADVLPLARALHELAGPSSKEIIAEHLNMSAAGGAFKTKFGTAQYYGLLKKEGGMYRLTSLGETAVDGDEGAQRAAVMKSGFGPLLRTLKGRNVSAGVVAARLREDHSVPPQSADRYAEVLIETATDVGLISDGRFSPSAIEPADRFEPGAEEPEEAEPEDAEAAEAEAARGPAQAPSTPTAEEPPVRRVREPPPAARPPIQINVNIDASKLSGDELLRLVRELQGSSDQD